MKPIMQIFFGKWESDFNFLVPIFRPSLFRVVLFFYISVYGSNHRRCSVKKDVLENFANYTGKHLCWSLLLLKGDSNLGAFCEICEFFKSPYFEERLRTAPSEFIGGHYALPWNNFKETFKWKNQSSSWQRV